MAKRRGKASRRTIRDVIARVQGDLNALTVEELQSARRFQALQKEIKEAICTGLGDKHSYRRNELADIFGVDERTISRWSKQGKLPQSSKGFWNIRDVLHCLHDQLEGVNRDGTPADRLTTVKALREELRLANDKSRVIDREAFVRQAAVRLTAARDRASGWPERLVRLFPADQRDQALGLIREEVRDFLRMVTEALHKPAGETT